MTGTCELCGVPVADDETLCGTHFRAAGDVVAALAERQRAAFARLFAAVREIDAAQAEADRVRAMLDLLAGEVQQ